MSQYDENKYTQNSGSAPRPEPRKPLEPAAKPLVVTEQDAPVVQCAAQMVREDEREAQARQTRGKQIGFTKTSVEGIIEEGEKHE